MSLCSIDGCGSIPHRRGLCRNHYHRLRIHGDPLGGRAFNGEPLAWIESHVNFDRGECLLWPFAQRGHGYGAVVVEGKPTPAHRVMCSLVNGPPPSPRAPRCPFMREGPFALCAPTTCFMEDAERE